MPSLMSTRAFVAVFSVIVALVAAYYSSLLPELPMFSRASKAVQRPVLSNFTPKAQYSSTNSTMATRPPVYFFSHGGVCVATLLVLPRMLLLTNAQLARCDVQQGSRGLCRTPEHRQGDHTKSKAKGRCCVLGPLAGQVRSHPDQQRSYDGLDI